MKEGRKREGGGRGRREEETQVRKKMEERGLREKIPFMVYELSVLTSTDFIPCETADSKALHADWDRNKHIVTRLSWDRSLNKAVVLLNHV